jgi:hypothetical protein
MYEIKKVCSICNGHKTIETLNPRPPDYEDEGALEEITCPHCNGEGVTLFGYVDLDDINDKLNDIFEKVNE